MEIFQTLLTPVATLIGVAIGGWSASATARANNIFQWNNGLMKESRDYYVEASDASNEIYLSLGALVQDMLRVREQVDRQAHEDGVPPGSHLNFSYEFQPGAQDRINKANARFRACLAKGIVHADDNLSSALTKLDEQRDLVTRMVNAGDMTNDNLSKEIEKLALRLKPVYLSIQLLKIRQSKTVIASGHRRRRRAMLKELSTSYASFKIKHADSVAAAE